MPIKPKIAYGNIPIIKSLKAPSLLISLPIIGENKITPNEGNVTNSPELKPKFKFLEIDGKAGAITAPTIIVKLLFNNNVIIVNFDAFCIL